ncbi:MAG: AfsR/SARP family transcriptional regulator, partial [Longimicrobiales bacterium]
MIRLNTLGRLEIDGIPNRSAQEILRQPKRFALLVHLALAADDDQYVRRDVLLALFWPSSDERRARRALNQALCFLRARLGHDTLLSRGNEEVGVAGEEVWCDARVFREVIEAGRLEDGLQLYKGDFLPGFHVDDALEFEHWADALRRELRDRAVDAAVALAEQAADAGDGAPLRARLREA